MLKDVTGRTIYEIEQKKADGLRQPLVCLF